MNVAQLGLPLTLAVFVAAAIAVLFAGLALTARAERLAAVTGLGQAVLGAVFLGAATSLSGTVTSVSAAWAGEAEIAYGNAIGGIAAQTTVCRIDLRAPVAKHCPVRISIRADLKHVLSRQITVPVSYPKAAPICCRQEPR